MKILSFPIFELLWDSSSSAVPLRASRRTQDSGLISRDLQERMHGKELDLYPSKRGISTADKKSTWGESLASKSQPEDAQACRVSIAKEKSKQNFLASCIHCLDST